MKLRIEIEMDNAAFEENEGRDELTRIFHVYSKTIKGGGDIERTFRDVNGNTVGKAEVIE